MAKPIEKKCQACAFTTFEHRKRPGCYHKERCRRIRSYYRHRQAEKAKMLEKYHRKRGFAVFGVRLCPTCCKAITKAVEKTLKGRKQ